MNGGFRTLMTMLLIVLTATAVFAGGFVAGHFTAVPGESLPRTGLNELADAEGNAPPADAGELFAPFWEAWDVVHEQYVDQPVDDVALMQGAISGMLEALEDPHTAYMSPELYEIESADYTGELEGIGALVEGATGGGLRIVSPFPGSPAEAAGLQPGDLVIAVDGEDVMGMDQFEIINLVRGPAGTTVHLTVIREGHEEPLEFDIVRARIVIPSVESEMLEGNIAYVKINDFGYRTTADLKQALEELLEQNPVGLVVDLRGNPGGLLQTAVEVASQFLPGGTLVMREQFGDEREIEYDAERGGLATEIPLVVLIDAGSASASEIVAGAIHDHGRGILVGETSYGKGSVQVWHELQGDNGAVRVTIARWYTPDGRSIHEEGIAPDIAVEVTEEDRVESLDPQLDAAIRALQDQAVPQGTD